MINCSEAYLGHCQTSRMEILAKIVKGYKQLTVLAKRSIIDVCQGSNFASSVNAQRQNYDRPGSHPMSITTKVWYKKVIKL